MEEEDGVRWYVGAAEGEVGEDEDGELGDEEEGLVLMCDGIGRGRAGPACSATSLASER